MPSSRHLRSFFQGEQMSANYLAEEAQLTEILLPPLEAKELNELRRRITEDYDVRRAAMYLKLLRYSYRGRLYL